MFLVISSLSSKDHPLKIFLQAVSELRFFDMLCFILVIHGNMSIIHCVFISRLPALLSDHFHFGCYILFVPLVL